MAGKRENVKVYSDDDDDDDVHDNEDDEDDEYDDDDHDDDDNLCKFTSGRRKSQESWRRYLENDSVYKISETELSERLCIGCL